MAKIETVFQVQEKIPINALDLHQVKIVNLYNQAINIPKIRQIIYFLCNDKGYYSGIKREGRNFFLDLTESSIQTEYQDRLIFFVKKILRAYHEHRILEITPFGQWWKVQATFDCRTLAHKERGILTKILKQENKRLETLGIKYRRQKRRYVRKIFEANFLKK